MEMGLTTCMLAARKTVPVRFSLSCGQELLNGLTKNYSRLIRGRKTLEAFCLTPMVTRISIYMFAAEVMSSPIVRPRYWTDFTLTTVKAISRNQRRRFRQLIL